MKNCNNVGGQGSVKRQDLRINTKETGFFTKIHRFPDRVKNPVSEPPQALCENTLQLQTAFNVTEAGVSLKPIAIFLRSQTDYFPECLTKVTLVVKSDLLGDILY